MGKIARGASKIHHAPRRFQKSRSQCHRFWSAGFKKHTVPVIMVLHVLNVINVLQIHKGHEDVEDTEDTEDTEDMEDWG